ncbi:putative PMS1 protein-like 1 [Apostichopus japonicus]|uniref:Putative PMS1 protein-like 1 n=1 Tax=Stichopus japonicus TaxID=307972 RepID=A0A2G8KDM7_STIJA|nr:putative PMS1 protein-like 1 [Apostichopus japonicus]
MQQLTEQTVRLLSSAQVITSVLNAVKELLENSLDAGADSVEVKLDNFGLDRIEVRDNGAGISSRDVPLMGQRHYTSKLKDFSDLISVTSYGFRGEALASLCAISDVSITTKRKEDGISRVHTLDHSGLVSSSKPSHLGNGTTVTSTHLFKNVPVRRQFYSSSRRKKEELKKVEDLLMCYGYVNPGVRFALSHNKKLVWQKNKVPSCKVALLNIVGSSVMNQMEAVDHHDNDTGVTINGFLPKAGSDLQLVGRVHSNDRCWIYINKRPVQFKEAERFSEVLRQSFLQSHSEGVTTFRYLTACLHFILPIETVDVNLEPDKRKVLLQNKDAVLTGLAQVLKVIYKKDCDKTGAESDTEQNGIETLSRLENSSENQGVEEGSCNGRNGALSDTDLPKKPETKEDQKSRMENKQKTLNEVREEPTFELFDDDDIFRDSQVSVGETQSVDKEEEEGQKFVTDLKSSDTSLGYCNQLDKDPSKPEMSRSEHLETEIGSKVSTDLIKEGIVTINEWSKGVVLGSKTNPVEPVMLLVPNSKDNRERGREEMGNVLCSKNGTAKRNGDVVMVDQDSRNVSLNPPLNEENRVGGHDKTSIVDILGAIAEEDEEESISNYAFSSNTVGSSLPSLPKTNSQTDGLDQILEGVRRGLTGEVEISKQTTVREDMSEHDKLVAILHRNIPDSLGVLDQASENNTTNGIRDNGMSSLPRSSFDLVNGAPLKRPEGAYSHFVKDYAPKGLQVRALARSLRCVLGQGALSPLPLFTQVYKWGPARYNKHLLGFDTSKKDTTSQQKDAISNPAKRKKLLKRPPLISNQGLIDQLLESQERKHRQNDTTSVKTMINTKEVPFSIPCLRKCSQTCVSERDEDNQRIISELLPHHYWIILQESKLLLFNHFRAEETVLFKRLMATHSLSSSTLEVPIVLSESMVGSENNWLSLLSMQCSPSGRHTISMCLDERLVANGFKLQRIIDQERKSIHLHVIGISDSIPCYGMADLIEILDKVSESPAVKLSNCRPLKVENYLKSNETVSGGRREYL